MAKQTKTTETTNQTPRQLAIKEIEKKYGSGSIMTLADNIVVPCEVISSGDPQIDIATGVGGIPRGRVIEIFGPESSGKTTLTLHIIAQAQKSGGSAAFIDAEHALDMSWARRIGVKIEELLFSQPDTGEEALDICEILVRGGDLDVIVIDSVAALVPRAEIEGEMGDSHMGLQARLMSQALRKLTGIVSKTKTTVIFINQIREKIGQMFGPSETTAGGRALKFYASTRIDIRRTGSVKEGEISIGNKCRVKIVKNKVAPPFREAEPTIYFGDPVCGFDCCTSLLETAATHEIVEKTGANFNYRGVRVGCGIRAAAAFLRSNPAIYDEIWAALWAKIGPKGLINKVIDPAGFDLDPVSSPDGPGPAKLSLAESPVTVVEETVTVEDDVEVIEGE